MIDDDLPENDQPVSSHLQDFDLPSFGEELAIWKTRCHELWLAASAASDLRAMAQSLQAAYRGLGEWRDSLESEKEATLSTFGEEKRHEIEVAFLDSLVAGTEADRQKNRAPCPICHYSGDRLRIGRFEKWLQEQDGRAADFAAWDERTPYQMSGTLEENGGAYVADEVGNSNSTN